MNYNNDDENKINKSKIISDALTLTIAAVFTAIIVFCLFLVAKPLIYRNNSKTIFSKYTGNEKKLVDAVVEIYEKLDKDFMGQIDIYAQIDGALAGIASATDDVYTRYLDDDEYNELLTSGTETFSGIGVRLTYNKDYQAIELVGIMPDSPAQEAGLKKGDYIIKVGDISVKKDTYEECVDAIKGEENTTVKLTVYRNSETKEYEVVRKKIKDNNVESELLDGNIGYIKVLQFENEIYSQFKNEFDKYKDSCNGLIIDLRDNPGGLVTETIKMLDLFLPESEVLKLVYNDGTTKVYKCKDSMEYNKPLVILVNENSASAAEIFSSAIKDSKKGILIGTKTYGKGIVQDVSKLSVRGAVSITVAKYYTASGIEIHKNGIEPDINVTLDDSVKNLNVIPKDKDNQLQEAINYIKNKM